MHVGVEAGNVLHQSGYLVRITNSRPNLTSLVGQEDVLDGNYPGNRGFCYGVQLLLYVKVTRTLDLGRIDEKRSNLFGWILWPQASDNC